MFRKVAAVGLLAVLTTFSSAPAADLAPKPVPPGGKVLIDADALLSAKSTGPQYAKVSTVDVQNAPFNKAVQVDVTTRPPKYYSVQTKVMKLPPIKKGDVVLVMFTARCSGGGTLETANGNVQCGLQDKESNDVLAKLIAEPGNDWQQFYMPFVAPQDVAAASAALSFSYGAMLQTVQVGGLKVIDYGTSVKLDDLPKTFLTYKGREPDAAWRAAADQRIDQLRKADLTVQVQDASGKPVPNASVDVKMTRHAFSFGAAVSARALQNNDDGKRLLEEDAKLFNQGVPISWMYWRDQTDSDAQHYADRLYSFFKEHHMVTRGHALMYERDDLIPPEIKKLIDDKNAAELKRRVDDYLTSQVKRFKGRVDEWVLENEAVDNNEIRELIGGDAAIADFAKIVRANDPTVKIMINENRIEGNKPDKSDRLLEIVKTVTDHGGPLDVIGIQGHMQSAPVAPETLLKYFDKLATSGKRLEVTEFDYVVDDPQLKADYVRDFYTACFSCPAMDGITTWRYWDGKPEHRESIIYANDWTLKPSGQAYKDLIFKKWWTNASGQTAANGQYSTRGFLGDYDISIKANGKSKTVPITLEKGGKSPIVVTLN